MEIIYSTKPLTVGNMADAQLAAKNDYVAIIRLVMGRTNLTEEQVRELDTDEVSVVINKIAEAVVEAIKLQNLSRQLGWEAGGIDGN